MVWVLGTWIVSAVQLLGFVLCLSPDLSGWRWVGGGLVAVGFLGQALFVRKVMQ